MKILLVKLTQILIYKIQKKLDKAIKVYILLQKFKKLLMNLKKIL